MGKEDSLLRDDPFPVVPSIFLKNSAVVALGFGVTVGITSRASFLLAPRVARLAFLNRFSPRYASLFCAAGTAFVGGIYGLNREFVKMVQPSTPRLPYMLEQAKDSHFEGNPRLSIAHRLIVHDIFKKEFGFQLGEKYSSNQILSSLKDMSAQKHSYHQHSLHHEIMAGCMAGWMVLPLMGSLIINSSIGILCGTSIYLVRSYIHNKKDYKLLMWMFKERIDLLEKQDTITEEESIALHSAMTTQLKPQEMKVRMMMFGKKVLHILSRAFPIIMKISQEEIDQKKYLGHIELEYMDWRAERGLKPVGRLFQ